MAPEDQLPVTDTPSRLITRGDGVAFLSAAPLRDDQALVTSLPDAIELPELGPGAWRQWFIDMAALCCRQTADHAVTIFYQTDVKLDGRWIDKSYLVQRGAEAAGSHLLWHKVVCRIAPGNVAFGRPAYAHLLCFSRELRLPSGKSTADVLPSLGNMTWSRAMGTAACSVAATFIRNNTACTTVVDPFCGVGTMLAVANSHGLHAVGVELSRRRAAKAQKLVLPR